MGDDESGKAIRSGRQRKPGLPVRAYLLTIPVAVLLFLGVALADQPDTLLSLLPRKAPVSVQPEAPTPQSQAAVALVEAFNASLAAAYEAASPEPLRRISISSELQAQIVQELELLKTLGLPAPKPGAGSVLQVEPTSQGGWEVTTEESWSAAGGLASRLRYRYGLVPEGGRTVISSMDPILPEPVREADR
jgi:hypothetical protein